MWRLTVAYRGGAFWGSQRQPARRTVQGVLETALHDFGGVVHPATFAGRTDRGVHAAGQVVGFPDVRPDLAEAVVQAALNARLPDDLAVTSVMRERPGFDARRDAVWREYRYRVWCGPPAPLSREVAWERRARLEPALVQAACERLLGRHDFAAFAGGGDGVPWAERRRTRHGTIRTVRICSARVMAPTWPTPADAAGYAIEVRIVADGFLPHMVRTIVGALVEIGSGSRQPAWIDELLRVADRRLGPKTAPPCGLVLWRVGYDAEEPAPDPDEGASGTERHIG